VGLSYPHPKIHTAGHPPFPFPQPHSPSGAQTNYGQLTPKGPTWGCAFCTPILGPWAVTPNPKNWRVAILGTPILGPSGSLALFCSFGLLSISGPPEPTSHLPIPTYRQQTHLSWGKPKLNSFFNFPIPHTGGNLH